MEYHINLSLVYIFLVPIIYSDLDIIVYLPAGLASKLIALK